MSQERQPHVALYKTRRWKALRIAQLQREPLCRMCAPKVTPATIADHIKPHRGNLNGFWHGQLQSLCASCHSGAKQSLEKSGKVRGCDENGIPFGLGAGGPQDLSITLGDQCPTETRSPTNGAQGGY